MLVFWICVLEEDGDEEEEKQWRMRYPKSIKVGSKLNWEMKQERNKRKLTKISDDNQVDKTMIRESEDKNMRWWKLEEEEGEDEGWDGPSFHKHPQ